MSLVIIPEIILLNTINNLLKLISENYNNQVDETTSLLYFIFGDLSLQRYGMFTQAKSVFITTKDNPRNLEVNIFFNTNRAHIPTIHIVMNDESPGEDGLGIDEGYNSQVNIDDEKYFRTYTRRFDTTYSLVITSDNSNEVLLIYHVLRNFLIQSIEHFSLSGLENPKISGSDIDINTELVPKNIFSRAMPISFSYEAQALSLHDYFIGNKSPADISVDEEDIFISE